MQTRAASSPDPYLNQMLVGRYRLVRLLGQGAMGRVYLAQDQQLGGVTIAIKILSQALVDPEARVRFEREAQACAYLGQKSLHIVRVNDFGLTETGIPFYVMEYLNGKTLRQILGQGPLPLARFYPLGRQIGLGLKAAHEGIGLEGHRVQVVHRDLKPGNVIVIADDSLGELAKIVDFGIAKLLSETGSFSVTNAYMGTLAYSSPEQLEGLPLDGRSDLYSFGVMMYEMVSGMLPILPERDSFPAWYQAHLKRAPRQLDPRHLDLPKGLEELILACLEKHPQDRPQSVSEVVSALDALSQGRSPLISAPELRGQTTTRRDRYPTLGTLRLGGSSAVEAAEWHSSLHWWQRLIPLAIGGGLGIGSFVLAWHGLQGWLELTPPPDQPANVTEVKSTPEPQTPSPQEQTPPRERPSDLQQLSPLSPLAEPAPNPSSSPAPDRSLPIFPVSTPRVAVRSQLGQPQESGTGFWPNTTYDLYRISLPAGGPVDLGLIYDRSTLALRQSEATVTDQMPEPMMEQILASMLQADPPQSIQIGLQQVRNGLRDQFQFQFEILEGAIERNAQGRLYIATWDPELHQTPSSGFEVNFQFDLNPDTLFANPAAEPGEKLQEIRQDRDRD